MIRKLFGTDGIRGKANVEPLTAEFMVKLGKAIGKVIGKNGGKVVIGKDTRISSYILETALSSGFLSVGIDVDLAGVIPTPAVAHITKVLNADIGIMISASHNPAEDNGVKVFDKNGFKLADDIEEQIEIAFGKEFVNSRIGSLRRVKEIRGRYIAHAHDTIGAVDLKGVKIVLDCANGAAYKVAPLILKELGASLIVLNADPNGENINDNCGAMYPEVICRKVMETNADIGISVDGDADRVTIADENGKMVDGDQILAMCAIDKRKNGTLNNNTVVTTIMSNLGFEQAMEKQDILVIKSQVGDRYVIEEMRKGGYVLGGEQSGHIIFMNHSTTGDGIVSSLQVLKLMKDSNKKLSELANCMKKVPQVLLNVPIKEKRNIEDLNGVCEAIKFVEAEMKGKGRVLVRYSGTEDIVRIMIEYDNKNINQLADKIADKFREAGI